MKKALVSFSFYLLIVSTLTAQKNNKKTLEELTSTDSPSWELISGWLPKASNKVKVLEVDSIKKKRELVNLQVSTFSSIGGVIYNSGGILIDNGWIRVLGSGSKELPRSVYNWNLGKSIDSTLDQQPAYIIVADDAIGGIFALNGGGLAEDNLNKVFYFDTFDLTWHSLDMSYTNFLYFCFYGNLEQFYEGLRWDSWFKDITSLKTDEIYFMYPPPFSEEFQSSQLSSRQVMKETDWMNTIFKND